MPTATKSAKTKIKKVAKPIAAEEEKAPDEIEGDFEAVPAKSKKPIEIDEIEPAVVVEEKVEEDPLIAATEEDELATDEVSLDSEELNPFGDRWEE